MLIKNIYERLLPPSGWLQCYLVTPSDYIEMQQHLFIHFPPAAVKLLLV